MGFPFGEWSEKETKIEEKQEIQYIIISSKLTKNTGCKEISEYFIDGTDILRKFEKQQDYWILFEFFPTKKRQKSRIDTQLFLLGFSIKSGMKK